MVTSGLSAAVQIQFPVSKGHFLKTIDLGNVFEDIFELLEQSPS